MTAPGGIPTTELEALHINTNTSSSPSSTSTSTSTSTTTSTSTSTPSTSTSKTTSTSTTSTSSSISPPTTTCAVCHIPSSLRCARCGVVFYCSRDHQTSDWKQHKKECKSSSASTSASTSTAKPKPRSNPQSSARANMPDACRWSQGLSLPQAYEWLIDCYRMRINDDYAMGGCHLHGLYNPEATSMTVVQDFTVFCLLCHTRQCLPSGWNWSHFLEKAQKLLPYAFEKSDAQEKYGRENVFAAMFGGRSLRHQAMMIYGYGAEPFISNKEEHKVTDDVYNQVEQAYQSQNPNIIFKQSKSKQIFQHIGGADAWYKLYSGMKLPSSNF